jgi:hypothetical protein
LAGFAQAPPAIINEMIAAALIGTYFPARPIGTEKPHGAGRGLISPSSAGWRYAAAKKALPAAAASGRAPAG